MKTKQLQCSTPAPKTAPLTLRCDYREDDFVFWPRPTELQLARLAAVLARTGKIDPQQLVEEAWALYWASCRVIQKDYREVRDFLEHEDQGHGADEELKKPGREPLPVPKRYPVPFKEVELLLLPKLKGRTADRARIMRDFLFEDFVRSKQGRMDENDQARQEPLKPGQLERLRDESREELESLFGQLRAMTFDARYYATFAEHFLDWHRARAGFVKSLVRSASARRSWEKRRKNRQARTGARPKHAELRQILESAAPPS